MDVSTLHRRTVEAWQRTLDGIEPEQWAGPTPCTEWDVRTLVNHVTYEQLWAPHLVGGETVADVGDRYEGDVLGDDPRASWNDAVAASLAAFASADLDATVHLSYADVPCGEYLMQMLTDAEIHGWDLAKAIGTDATINPEAATYLYGEWVQQEELVRGSGMFGNAVEVADDADDATKLLALLGRQA